MIGTICDSFGYNLSIWITKIGLGEDPNPENMEKWTGLDLISVGYLLIINSYLNIIVSLTKKCLKIISL